jgi:hypothetical protein
LLSFILSIVEETAKLAASNPALLSSFNGEIINSLWKKHVKKAAEAKVKLRREAEEQRKAAEAAAAAAAAEDGGGHATRCNNHGGGHMCTHANSCIKHGRG